MPSCHLCILYVVSYITEDIQASQHQPLWFPLPPSPLLFTVTFLYLLLTGNSVCFPAKIILYHTFLPHTFSTSQKPSFNNGAFSCLCAFSFKETLSLAPSLLLYEQETCEKKIKLKLKLSLVCSPFIALLYFSKREREYTSSPIYLSTTFSPKA